MRTLGVSPKAVLAFLFPVIAATLTALASFVVSGNFSASEIQTAVGGLLLSGISLLGAWLGAPGDVVPAPVVSSDDRLLKNRNVRKNLEG